MAETKVVTGKVRLSYPNLFEAKAVEEGQEAKYSASLIIDKDDKKTLKKIEDAVKAAIEEGKAKFKGGKVPKNLKLPLRDGDEDREDDEAYQDKMFLNASSKRRPGAVDQRMNKIDDPEDLYPGCYVRASLNFYVFNVSGNQGVAVGLNNIQKWAEGETLAGGSSAEEDFGELDTDEDDIMGDEDDLI